MYDKLKKKQSIKNKYSDVSLNQILTFTDYDNNNLKALNQYYFY